jgi:putative nucleotidyltransferase with HDIG domain
MSFHPKGGLRISAEMFLNLSANKHQQVREHSIRVAFMSETVAIALKMDAKAAFFGGLLHDIGKIVLPYELYDGHNITADEYLVVKLHAKIGFETLKSLHLFTSVVCGLHHNMYKNGYGIDVFPSEWNKDTVSKAIEISSIVSICDFIDAYTTRNTEIKDGYSGNNLIDMLHNKYPGNKTIVDVALDVLMLNSTG